jgi:hypothetical protein
LDNPKEYLITTTFQASLKIHIQNLVLGKQPRVDFIEELQSISRFRMKGFPIHLPFRERAAALEDPSLAELENKRRELSISDNVGRKQVEREHQGNQSSFVGPCTKKISKRMGRHRVREIHRNPWQIRRKN